MKRFLLILVVVVILFCCGCSCKHNWIPATCSTPMMCNNCGEVNGYSLGHVWVEATCNKLKTCSLCGIQEGTLLQHSWIDATCMNAQTCSVCGITVGECSPHMWTGGTCETQAVCEFCGINGNFGEHQWIEATYEHAKYCSTCKLEEGLPLLDATDVRYVLAACAYRIVLLKTKVPSSVIIERACFATDYEECPYPTVILECSGENSLGGRGLVRCYAYQVADEEEANKILPKGDYFTFNWPYGDFTIYCRIVDVTNSSDGPSIFSWEELVSELVIRRYNNAFS